MNFDNEEKRKMHQDLRHLIDKCMALKIGTSSSIENLLNIIDLSYNVEIMMMSLPPKFKVLQMKYNVSKNIVEHLETFKTHMTLHGFFREIACQSFPLTLKGVAKGCFGAL